MKNQYLRKIFPALYVPVAANIWLITYCLYYHLLFSQTLSQNSVILALLLLVTFLLWICINLYPRRADRGTGPIGLRLKIMIGGRTLCGYGLYGLVIQFLIFLTLYPQLYLQLQGTDILWFNAVYAIAIDFILLWNGILRIFFTSRRLSIQTRALMFLAMWIPLVNLIVLLHALNLIRDEYDFACYKSTIHQSRAESNICETRYPLVMVHGVGFRDLRYFNYWGRIPKELIRYGASVYYGNQEAFGTIAYNAQDIRKNILEIIRETDCEKVNIIAHSKGGLDSRYAISKLGMDEYVASLTTISTPHHGCRFVDYACRLPESLYRLIARYFDHGFHKFGDTNPDFYTATHQFSTVLSRQFNEETPDSPKVYYQSYATKMRDCLSDPLLALPYCLIKPLEGDNDGLVSVESAKWGEFRGVIANRYHRGISHGDIIDLKREDYKGFDIVEEFVKIVSDLKESGF